MIAVVALCVASVAASGQTLERKVQQAIEKARLGGGQIGISIVDCDSGRELVNIVTGDRERRGFTPASNLKLLTSGAALATLGADYEFRTQLISMDNGRLVVRGSGDPAFADPELLSKMQLGVDQFVDRLVESVAKAGVTGIREVIVDDRVFDREYVHADWPAAQLNRAYCAQVSGVNFHANVLNVYVAPAARIGEAASARSEPQGNWLTIQRLAKTVGGKDASAEVWLERDKEPYSFRLHGSVRTAPDQPIQVTVHEPGLMFARVLADRLAKAGLTNPGQPASGRLVGIDEQLTGIDSAPVVALVRTPISVVLERCNVDSDNLYAESLLKAAGHRATGQPGSWSNGTAVVRMQLKDMVDGDTASRLIMADGSGLSKNNRVTPDMLTKWLRAMAEKPVIGDMFVRSLAKAGEEGTLKKRFKGSKLKNEVRAKSGYIAKVRTLSGYVTSPETGRRVAFSVLVDSVPSGSDQRAKELHENVVEFVDAWLSEQPRVAREPRGTPPAPQPSNAPAGEPVGG